MHPGRPTEPLQGAWRRRPCQLGIEQLAPPLNCSHPPPYLACFCSVSLSSSTISSPYIYNPFYFIFMLTYIALYIYTYRFKLLLREPFFFELLLWLISWPAPTMLFSSAVFFSSTARIRIVSPPFCTCYICIHTYPTVFISFTIKTMLSNYLHYS